MFYSFEQIRKEIFSYPAELDVVDELIDGKETAGKTDDESHTYLITLRIYHNIWLGTRMRVVETGIMELPECSGQQGFNPASFLFEEGEDSVSSITEIFEKAHIDLYQNESLDLDHYYQEPYQDIEDEIKDMGNPFEADKSQRMRRVIDPLIIKSLSSFSYFMDGSRRTYKIGDIVLGGKKIYPVVVAQVRAGCCMRDASGKLHSAGMLRNKNLLLVSNKINNDDFREIRKRIIGTEEAKSFNLDVISYEFREDRDIMPVNAAIAKANAEMHRLEIDILIEAVNSKLLDTDRMLVVDGPLQFIREDTGKADFADLFYNTIGLSKSFDPMMPVTSMSRKKGAQIGAELLRLEYGYRTPVFLKTNKKRRRFGCWYLRIRPRNKMANPLDGIVKIEKMATEDDKQGLDTTVVDNISLSILNEAMPTCYGNDARWPGHIYPIYLTERLIKASFESDLRFINRFKRDYK